MHRRGSSRMGLGLDHRLRVLLGDPTVWGDVVTLHTGERA